MAQLLSNSAVICAQDVLATDGEDLRDLALSMRKGNLERLLRGRPDRMFINPFEIGGLGLDLFRAACDLGLEGLVSKRRHWVKVKIGPITRLTGCKKPCADLRLDVGAYLPRIEKPKFHPHCHRASKDGYHVDIEHACGAL